MLSNTENLKSLSLYTHTTTCSFMMTIFYHYTDVDGCTAIQESRKILNSLFGGVDAVFGTGVYLTTLNPNENTKEEITKNNWLDAWEHNLKKTASWIQIEIPDSDKHLTKAPDDGTGRDVWLYVSDEDLLLDNYDWTCAA